MPAKFFYRKSAALTAMVGLSIVLLFVGGCGKAPPKVEYYERELAIMREKKSAKIAEESQNEAISNDGYPWRSSNKNDSSLPSRIKTLEKTLDVEIKCLEETVHGRKSSRLKN